MILCFCLSHTTKNNSDYFTTRKTYQANPEAGTLKQIGLRLAKDNFIDQVSERGQRSREGYKDISC